MKEMQIKPTMIYHYMLLITAKMKTATTPPHASEDVAQVPLSYTDGRNTKWRSFWKIVGSF
jgi:hypothetical protein